MRTSEEDEDLARKTTGKPRDPKPVHTEISDAVQETRVTASVNNSQDQVDDAAPTDMAPTEADVSMSTARSEKSGAADSIDDAEVVSETPAPVTKAADRFETVDNTSDTTLQGVPVQGGPTKNSAASPNSSEIAAETAAETDAEIDSGPAASPDDTATDTPPRTPPAAPAPKPSFLPMLLGGAVAAALGYGAHMLTQTQTPVVPVVDISALESNLASLRADVQGLNIPDSFDPSSLNSQIAALGDAITQLQNAAPVIDPAAFDALAAQVQAAASTASALATDMGALRADMAALQAEVMDLRDLAETRVATAEAAVDQALARAGLDSLRAALETGEPFTNAVTQIAQGGYDVPAPLTAIADAGIVTPEALIESFDASARAALRASLTDAPAASTSERLGNFLRAQVGARSTVPRDGDDPDAVLSRAGAAVALGDFDAALQELSALPQAGQAAMAIWTDAVRTRAAALMAVPDLTQAIAP